MTALAKLTFSGPPAHSEEQAYDEEAKLHAVAGARVKRAQPCLTSQPSRWVFAILAIVLEPLRFTMAWFM